MLRVGVLRGGTGEEYEASLTSGGYVLEHLPKDICEAIDVYVDRSGIWHVDGVPVSHDKLKHRVDLVWNTLHGYHGEDGKVQHFFEQHGIPYTGARTLPASIVMNRKLLHERLAHLGVATPQGVYIEEWGEEADTVEHVVSHVVKKLSPPWKVSAISRGHFTNTLSCMTRGELYATLGEMYDAGIPVLVEQEVFGDKAHIATFSHFRNKDCYVCIPSGIADREVKRELERIAHKIHTELDLGDYGSIDAVVTPRGKIYITHVETQPRLHKEGVVEKALHAVGATFTDVARSIVRKFK